MMLQLGTKVELLGAQIAVIGTSTVLGYVAEESGGGGEDGGTDVAIETTLFGAGERVLHQMLLQLLGMRQYHLAEIATILQIAGNRRSSCTPGVGSLLRFPFRLCLRQHFSHNLAVSPDPGNGSRHRAQTGSWRLPPTPPPLVDLVWNLACRLNSNSECSVWRQQMQAMGRLPSPPCSVRWARKAATCSSWWPQWAHLPD